MQRSQVGTGLRATWTQDSEKASVAGVQGKRGEERMFPGLEDPHDDVSLTWEGRGEFSAEG